MSKYKNLLLDEYIEDEITDFNIFSDENLDIKNKIEDEKIIYYDPDDADDADDAEEFYDIITDSNLIPEIKIEIETDENGNKNSNIYIYNPWFILDFTFAILAYICIFSCNQINKKFIILTFLVFLELKISNIPIINLNLYFKTCLYFI